MSTMYFAKLNFNSDIYKIYEDESLRRLLLDKVYSELSESVAHIENEEKFKFITLIKNPDEFWISGRLILVAPGVNTSYDAETDDLIEEPIDNKAASVSFFFDVNKEQIAFVPKRDFGHNMFIREFKFLLEMCIKDMEVEIHLEKNINLLKEKMSKLSFAQKITVDIVPPNGDKAEYDALFSTGADEIKDTLATKFLIVLGATAKVGINLSSKYINKLTAAVSKGYGKMEVIGKDTAGNPAKVTSDVDALYTKAIRDQDKDNLVELPLIAKAAIAEILENKIRINIEN